MPLTPLGWSDFFEEQRAAMANRDLRFARVIEEQRGLYHVAGEFDGAAEVAGRFRHEAASRVAFPAVGDWVGLAVHDSGSSTIVVRLERRSVLSRRAAGRATDEQVLAANVDTIFLVTALAEDLNVRRLERGLTMVWDAGALPVVVLNKADLCPDWVAIRESIRSRLPGIDVITTSALQDEGLENLLPYLTPATTVALIGSSGVGKSTLVNRLLGRDEQSVAPIRESDGRGRHTTTARQLFELRGGALLIDTPGIRELQLWTDEESVTAAFDDIGQLAQSCRFSDCAHTTEPGCAVLEGVNRGTLSADRLENYRRLLREAAFEERKRDKAAAANTKRRWKQVHKEARVFYRDRDREP